MITDMTEGSPAKSLWAFSIPLLLSAVFQQLYNIADSVIAGQFINKDALAAVGASYPITMIFMAIATGANVGCAVIISQLFGAKKYTDMKTAISTSIISVGFLSVILTVLGMVFSKPLMELLQTPSEIFKDSSLYLDIYIGGLAFLFLYNICTGVFTALGDSRTPLILLICSSVGNIFLDIVFVAAFKMGVGGVAWATFIAQGISSILALLILLRKIRLIVTLEKHKLYSFQMLGKISVMAVPSILQQSFVSVGNLFIQGKVNAFGPDVIAGYSAAIKLNTFAITSFTTLANGISSFTAQNIGAGKIDRVKRGYKSGLLMAACVVLPFIMLYYLFSGQMINIFVKANETDVINVGISFLQIVSPFYIFVAIKLMTDGVLRGAGSAITFMVATFSDLAIRVIMAFILVDSYGSNGIWMSWPVGWVISTSISCIFYFSGIWKRKTAKFVPGEIKAIKGK